MGLIIKASYVPTAQTGAGSGFSGGGMWVLPSLPLPIPRSSSTLDLVLVLGRGCPPPPCPGPQLLQSHMPSPAPCLSFPTRCPRGPRASAAPHLPAEDVPAAAAPPGPPCPSPPHQDPSGTKRGTELGRGAAGFDEIIPAGGITQGKTGD